MNVVNDVVELRRVLSSWRGEGARIGLVPTMGALHEGHLRLVDAARQECDRVVVSLFVNPLQFGPSEDLERYPRDLAGDRALLEARGTSLLFAPVAGSMYPPGFETHVVPGSLSSPLCGAVRPGHFEGVTTVVTKLFHQTAPHAAYFGQKDFQQVRVIERMVEDLDFDLEVRVMGTVREADGLALSSRNRYLSPEERRVAPRLHAALLRVEEEYHRGERDPATLRRVGRELLERSFPVEYLEVLDDQSLRAAGPLPDRGVVAAAVRIGSTRLIDNLLLGDARRRLLSLSTEAARR